MLLVLTMASFYIDHSLIDSVTQTQTCRHTDTHMCTHIDTHTHTHTGNSLMTIIFAYWWMVEVGTGY